jgi:hypothetical protein
MRAGKAAGFVGRILGKVVVLTGMLVLAAACQANGSKAFDPLKLPVKQARIALMPMDVELVELSAAGVPEPKADWTEAARRYLAESFDAEQKDRGLTFVSFDESKAPPQIADTLHQLQKLHLKVGEAAMLHHYVPVAQLPAKEGKFDWTLGPAARALKQATGADYALFVLVRDSYSSAERKALIVAAALFRVSIPGGVQLGFASLVDLETGNVVWFNRLLNGAGDLRDATPARETAKQLLAGFPQ